LGYFPLPVELVEGREDFKRLPPTAKLYFFFLMSKFNRNGPFYLSDIRASIILNVSTKTIQRARSELETMGLIKTIHGFRTKRGFNNATQYSWVAYAKRQDSEWSNTQYAQIKHYALHAMLHQLRHGVFDHADLVVYLYIYYWWQCRGGYMGVAEIFKSKLKELSGLRDAHIKVKKLWDEFLFYDRTHLFEYKEQYHKIVITDWTLFPDPEINEQAHKRMELFNQEIDEMVRERNRKLAGLPASEAPQQ
jgi:hypothetical protein